MYECHAHTRRFSPDSVQSLEQLVEAARAAGYAGAAATEHMDPDLDKGLLVFDVDEYFRAMDEARLTLPPDFCLLNGMEAGYLPHLVKRFEKLAAAYPFDHIIGSVHALDGDDIYFVREVYKRGREAAYGSYLDQLADMVQSGAWFDVVGHYDYVTRFSGYSLPQLTYAEQPDRFDRLFNNIVETGKSLELNARSIRAMERLGYSDPMPDPQIFRRYRELGGELEIGRAHV